jgi:transcriptional regulator with XRE-family HTH domain
MAEREAVTTVRERRLRQGWTLEDLAQRCAAEGVPTALSTLGRIERGSVPRPQLRATLAKLLDLDVTDFERKAS